MYYLTSISKKNYRALFSLFLLILLFQLISGQDSLSLPAVSQKAAEDMSPGTSTSWPSNSWPGWTWMVKLSASVVISAPNCRNMISVWFLVGNFSMMVDGLPASRATKIAALLTWALATSSWISAPCSFCPMTVAGRAPAGLKAISAPNLAKGWLTRFIGRLIKEASPIN